MVRILIYEVKSKNPVFETKLSVSRINGFHRKLEFTQGILVSCDGCSGGLEML